MTVVLLGVPTNSSGRPDGVARAPAALREAGLVERVAAAAGSVIDDDDVGVDPPVGRRGEDGIIDGPQLAATLGRLRDRVADAHRAGRRPIVIGGDCPVLIGALAGCGDAAGAFPGLLFVDGHEDAWPPDASPTGEAADMELGLLLGRHTARLDSALAAQLPRLEPQRVAILGARDRAEIRDAGIESLDGLITLVDDTAVRRDPAGVARAAIMRIGPGGRPWWLHVDLDVLSSEALPAVDYPQPGGLDRPDLAALTSGALAMGGCLGVTVTIYNPDLDPGRGFAPRVVDAIAAIAADLERSAPHAP
jgi:arginase